MLCYSGPHNNRNNHNISIWSSRKHSLQTLDHGVTKSTSLLDNLHPYHISVIYCSQSTSNVLSCSLFQMQHAYTDLHLIDQDCISAGCIHVEIHYGISCMSSIMWFAIIYMTHISQETTEAAFIITLYWFWSVLPSLWWEAYSESCLSQKWQIRCVFVYII